MGLLRYYSKVVVWSGRANDHYLQGFVPVEGPNGGRVIIDKMHIYASVVMDNATATNEGEDVHRLFNKINVTTAQGKSRWLLDGDASRIAIYELGGADAFPENADISSSASALAVTVHQAIPFERRYIHTVDDFLQPADSFGQVIITGPSATTLDIGSADATLTSISFYAIAECHEDLDLQFYCHDEVKQDNFQTTTQATMMVDGKLHDLMFHATGASGGASLANFTALRIDQPALLPLSQTSELLKEYRVKRRIANNLNSTMGGELRADPFANGRAIPVFAADERTSCWEGVFIQGEMKIDATNSVSSVRAISRIVKPRDIGAMLKIAAAYGLKGDNALVVKTDAKTKRALSAWPEHLRGYLRLKANLKARQAAVG